MRRRDLIGTGLLALPGFAGCRAEATSTSASAFHSMRRFLRTDFGRVAYVERGSGEAALFLHGFPLNGFQWRGALDRLAAFRRCVAPDFMGLGFTEPRVGQRLEPAAQAAMCVALMDALSLDRVDIVANDSGVAVAQLMAVNAPIRVRSMLLTNGDVEFDCPPPPLMPVIELAKAGRWVDQLVVPWLADQEGARAGLGARCYSDPRNLTDEAIDCYLSPLVRSRETKDAANGYGAALERNALAGIEARLRRCAIPTRIVWGEADGIFSIENPAYLDRLLPNSRGVRRIPAGKLFFPEEYPNVIAEEALNLWGSL